MSVPAASTRIKNLEESVGSKLLHRTSQGVTLTAPGQALAHHARLVLQQIEQLRGDLHEYAQGKKGHVRMLASGTAIEFLPAVLRDYLSARPDVNIDLRERLSPDIVRAVSDGSADIGIVAGPVRTEGLVTLPYRRNRLVLVVPAGHALAERESVPFAETLDLDHVGQHEASAIHGFLSQIASELRRTMKMRIEVGNFEAQCRMIEANVGVGIASESAAQRYAQTMNIRVVALADAWALRELRICMRSLELLPAFARELVGMLVKDGESAG